LSYNSENYCIIEHKLFKERKQKMKKHLLVVIALVSLLGFKPEVNAQTGFNSLLEYCTGTWCGYCPCGHDIVNGILANYPNTMVLAYHGASSDPWKEYSLPMIQAFGFNSYPTGVVGRRTGIISRSGWNNQIVIQSNSVQPGVSITLNNKAFNTGSRTVTGDIVLTALTTLSGSYNLFIVITEDNLVYPQNFYASCGTAGWNNNYVHKHVVKALVNGADGQLLNTTDDWSNGTSVTVPLNFVIPAHIAESNAKINMVVFKAGGNISVDQHIQQTKVEPVTSVTGIINQNQNPEGFVLGQNYPNPFNPSTNIMFSIPEDDNVTLQFYNSTGQVIATYIDNGFLKAGVYNADFDGRDLSSGIYFYTLKTSKFTETKKMMLVK